VEVEKSEGDLAFFMHSNYTSGHGENATPTQAGAMIPLSPNLSPASGREGQSEPLRDFHVNASMHNYKLNYETTIIICFNLILS
jgi:hypothetical protein